MARGTRFFLGCLFTYSSLTAYAQVAPPEPSHVDEDYISEHKEDLLIRLYGSHKFTRLSFGEYGKKENVRYKPNGNYNIGFGFNYQWLGINLGFNAPFINNDEARRGKTKYLDLQAYLYLRKVVVDLYAQSYRGYYLSNDNIINQPAEASRIRGDIRTRSLGASVEYIFNNRRFSYRAAFLQNEYQQKSAGSFMAGGGFLFTHVKGDSALLPANIKYENFLSENKFNRSATTSFNVNAGYAYTLVINKHFFLLGSVLLGVGGNNMTIKDDIARTGESKLSLSINGIVRAGIGYNSHDYFAGIYYVNNLNQDEMPIINSWQRYETGLFRIAFAKRFVLPSKVTRALKRTGLF
jgi:hypothetical protein